MGPRRKCNNGVMHCVGLLVGLLLLTRAASAQTLLPKSPTLQHITVATAASVEAVAPGGSVTLWAEVTPKPNVHVYASDSNGTTPVALTVTPHAKAAAGKTKYAAPEMVRTLGEVIPVAAYRKPFRIEQPVTVARSMKPGEVLTISGVVHYQACDDRVCYPAGAVPVSWDVKIKP